MNSYLVVQPTEASRRRRVSTIILTLYFVLRQRHEGGHDTCRTRLRVHKHALPYAVIGTPPPELLTSTRSDEDTRSHSIVCTKLGSHNGRACSRGIETLCIHSSALSTAQRQIGSPLRTFVLTLNNNNDDRNGQSKVL
jgi:hypothetical protein